MHQPAIAFWLRLALRRRRWPLRLLPRPAPLLLLLRLLPIKQVAQSCFLCGRSCRETRLLPGRKSHRSL